MRYFKPMSLFLSVLLMSVFIYSPMEDLRAEIIEPQVQPKTELPYLGDLNGDKVIDVGDSIRLLRHIAGINPLLDFDILQRADVNIDGAINVADAILILRKLISLIPDFPVSDPAYVSTETALLFVLEKTDVEAINLNGDIELSAPLVISRKIDISGENGLTKYKIIGNVIIEESDVALNDIEIDGTLTVAEEADSFTVRYLTVDTLILNGGTNSVNLENITVLTEIIINAEVTIIITGETNRIPGITFNINAAVSGGDNINIAFISTGIHVEWIGGIEPDLIVNESRAVLVGDVNRTAGEEFDIEVFINSRFDNSYNVKVISDRVGQIFNDIVSFSEGQASFSLSIETAGEHTLQVEVGSEGVAGSVVVVNILPAGISAGESKVEMLSPVEVPASCNNVSLELTIKDVSCILISGEYQVIIGDWFEDIVEFVDGAAVIDLSVTRADSYYYNNVLVDDEIIGSFNVFVVPGPVSEELSEANMRFGEVVTAGDNNVSIELILKDAFGNMISGEYEVVIEDWYQSIELFPGFMKTINFGVTESGEYLGNTVLVNGINIGSFDLTVNYTGVSISNSSLSWDGSPAAVDALANLNFTFTIILKDLYDNSVADLTPDSSYFGFYVFSVTENEPAAGVFNLVDINEDEPGVYEVTATYNIAEEIKITVTAWFAEIGDVTVELAAPAFSVSFNSIGGSNVEDITEVAYNAKIDAPADPVKESHTFDGWYKDADLTEKWWFTYDKVTDDITLYAGWLLNHTVTFETNGGSPIEPIDSAAHNRTISAPYEPSKEGHALEGWYQDIDLMERWSFRNHRVQENITLYAKWVNRYTVTFESNGGSVVPSVTDALYNGLVKVPGSPSKDLYSFAGWFKDDGLTDKWDFTADRVFEDITLYAKWVSGNAVKIMDPNLLSAVIENILSMAHWVDAEDVLNEDGMIKADYINFAIGIHAANKNITTLEGIQGLENLETLFIIDNYIEDISPLLELNNLAFVALENNNLKTSILREKCPVQLAIIQSLKDNGVYVGGQRIQRVLWEEDEGSIDNATWKVLVVTVKSMNMKASDGSDIIFELSEDEVLLSMEYARLFKESIEKIMNYNINIELDTYVTQETVTGDMRYGWTNNREQYMLFAHEIDEIHEIIDNYDSTITLLRLNDELTSVAGLGSFNHQYNVGTASVYLCNALKQYEFSSIPLSDALEMLRNNSYDMAITTMQHEFIHTMEFYGLGLDIWEFHDALAHFRNESSGYDYDLHSHKYYMEGATNPANSSEHGIIDYIWRNPPTLKETIVP